MRKSKPVDVILAREAEKLLAVSRTKLHVLATSGQLAGKLIDSHGKPRHWTFKRLDVLRLKSKGGYLRQHPKQRKQKLLWQQYVGVIPSGFTAAFRDGDRSNQLPENLCLLPLKAARKGISRRRKQRHRVEWTAERVAYVLREFPKRPTLEISKELDISMAALTRQAKRLRLRKDAQFRSHQARIANRLPIGTERTHDHSNTVWIKVSYEGTPYQQWRPRQQVIWEAVNHQRVAPGYCVIFQDGNKRNFEASNLALISRRERAAQGFAKFISQPEPLRRLIKLNAKLGREIERSKTRQVDREAPPHEPTRHLTQPRRWSAEMDEILCRDYPTMPTESLRETLGVSLSSLRQRARRLHIRRSPETIVAEARAASRIGRYQEQANER